MNYSITWDRKHLEAYKIEHKSKLAEIEHMFAYKSGYGKHRK